jgi:hypothetical protein
MVAIGDSTLYLGDCRHILTDIRGDVVITDPVWPNAPDGMFPGVHCPETLLYQALGLMPWLQRAVIVLRSDSDPRFLRAVPERLPFFLAQVLQYVMPEYIGRKLGGNEIAYSFGAPAASEPGRRVIPGMSPKIQPRGRKANGHPCSRAFEHFEWLMRWHSDAGQTVIDPFMGSGTTGYAAMRAGRRFIGIEINPEYFDIACERIERAHDQHRLFA